MSYIDLCSLDKPSSISIDEGTLKSLLHTMLYARVFDKYGETMQLMGYLSLWVSLNGQEAVQSGSVNALSISDVIFPSYREHAIILNRGIKIEELFDLFAGVNLNGWSLDERNVQHYTLILANQVLHAVGYAYYIKYILNDHTKIVVAYCGDGATSEGDFMVALNFASVWEVPILIICQNNQWAISTNISEQTYTPIYRRVLGFGIKAYCIDGNNILDSFLITKEAREYSLTTGKPVFIEAITYRTKGHTTSDNPNLYRDKDSSIKDPIKFFIKYLIDKQIVSEIEIKNSISKIESEISKDIDLYKESMANRVKNFDLFKYIYHRDNLSDNLLDEEINDYSKRKEYESNI